MATIVINGQEYLIELGAGGYSYYRVPTFQRFGKKVTAKDGKVAVWGATDGTPDPDLGLNGVVWGSGASPSPIVTAKSVVFDIADNWGAPDHMVIREIAFYYKGSEISMSQSEYSAYANSYLNDDYHPRLAFDTSLSKIGFYTGNSWLRADGNTNARIIIVFNNNITFDEIVINNGHASNSNTDRGVRNVKITISSDIITDTTYNASISNDTILNNSEWPEHGSFSPDNQTVWVAT